MQAILWIEGKISTIKNDMTNNNTDVKGLVSKEVKAVVQKIDKGFANRDMIIRKNHEIQVSDNEAVQKKLGKVTKDSTRALGEQENMQRIINKEIADFKEETEKQMEASVAKVGLDIEVPVLDTEKGDWSKISQNIINPYYKLDHYF
jgi:hypothetical protein